MPTQLSLHDVARSYDHRVVLDQVTCAFPPGQVLVEEPEAALDRYAGALVVVSHDRRFSSRWRGTVLNLKETCLVSH